MKLVTREFSGPENGPNLLVLGAIHGIEICGPIAIDRIIKRFEDRELSLKSGRVLFVAIANPEAFEQKQRYSGRDLNRDFRPRPNQTQLVDEYANELSCLMMSFDVLLDIHSFRAEGRPFIFVGPENNSGALEPFAEADAELAFAKSLGINTMVYGWLESYTRFTQEQNQFLEALPHGTLAVEKASPRFGIGTTEYFRSLGNRFGVTIECGQHDSPDSVMVGENAISNALLHLRMIDGKFAGQPVSESFRFSRIFIRHHTDDRLVRKFHPFESLKAGEPLGIRNTGEMVTAPENGAVIFQYENAQVGKEWIYFASLADRMS